MDRLRTLALCGAGLFLLLVSTSRGPEAALARGQATDVCASLPSGSLPDATVWTAAESPYMVNCDLRVANTASSLTIQAGVQVLFATGKRLRVEGPLTVEGTGPDSVIFDSQQANPQRGDWRGVEIVEGLAPVVLSGLTLRHAGAPDSPTIAAFQLRREGASLTDVTIEDSAGVGLMLERITQATLKGLRVRRNVGAGLEVNESSAAKTTVTLEGSSFQGNAEAVKAGGGVELVLSGNSAEGNAINGILVKTTRIAFPTTWHGGDLPMVLGSTLYVEGPLTIQPGTLVKFKGTETSLRVGNKGSLVSAGSAEKPITFTAMADDSTCSSATVACDTGNDGAAAPGPGSWSTIEIGTAAMDGNQFSHTVVRFGGAGTSFKVPMFEIKKAGTQITQSQFLSAGGTALRINDVSASVSGSLFSGNGDDGINIGVTTPDNAADNVVDVTDCRFEKNGGAAITSHPNAVLNQSGNSMSGAGLAPLSNKINGIRMAGGDITRPIVWQAGNLPYVVADRSKIEIVRGNVRDAGGRIQGSSLTVAPGVVVKMGIDAQLINSGGEMQVGPAIDGATGLFTPGPAPVLVTSILDDACDALSSARDCDTGGDGPSDPRPGSWAQLELAGAGRSTVAGAVIRYGGAVGRRGAAVVIRHDKDEVRGSEVAFSEGAGILVTQIAAAFISDCNIHDNMRSGIRAEASTTQGLKLFLSGNTVTDNPGPGIDTDANVAVVPDTIDRPAGNTVNPAKPNLLERNAINGVAVHGTVNVDRTWEPVGLNYYVTGDVTLAFGKTLILKPGVQVRFKNTSLISPAGTRLVAAGTAEKPVVFTSHNADGTEQQPGPGDWTGLVLSGCISASDESSCSRLDHVEVRYTGGPGARQDPAIKVTTNGISIANALIESGTGDGVRFDNASGRLNDSLIRKMSGDGVSIKATGTGLINPDLSRTRIEECRSVVRMDASAQPGVTGLTFARNQVNGILVQGIVTRQGQVRWGRGAAPYVIHADDVRVGANATLLIDAGTVVKSQNGGTLHVDRSGALTVPSPGSGSDPVRFSSLRDDATCTDIATDSPDRRFACDTNNDEADSRPAAGDWAGIVYNSLASGLTLDNVSLDYAGQDGRAIMLTADRAVIRNSRIRWSRGHGVLVTVPSTVTYTPLEFVGNLVEGSLDRGLSISGQWEPSTFHIKVADNRFVRNGRSVEHRAKSPTDYANNVAVGNVADAMLYCSDVTTVQTWSNDLVRELDCNLGILQPLLLNPGTVLMLKSGGLMRVEGAGKLDADGVVLTANVENPGAGYWNSVGFAAGNAGGGSLKNSLILSGGRDLVGVVSIAAESPAVSILNNLFLRSSGLGMLIRAAANEKVEIAGNIVTEVVGSTTSAVIRAENASRPNIHHNRLSGAQVGLATLSDAKPKLDMNSFTSLGKLAIENTDIDTCVDARRQWWGDLSGPLDRTNSARDACGPEIVNLGGKGLPVTEGVRYAPWLVAEMPAAPMLESPQCGVTNQSRIQVTGRTSPDAFVQAYDRDVAVGSPVRANGDGSFSFELNLVDGEHRLTFDAGTQQALSDGQTVDTRSPRTGFRRVTVASSSRVDPARLQFAYGSGSTSRVQMVRDVTGCSVGCGAFTGGRVTIPPATEITVAVPVTGNPSKVSFIQPGQPEIPLSFRAASGLWESAPFLPRQDTYDLTVDGEASGACRGFLYVGETGVVFSDSGVQAPPTVSEDFESGKLTDWVTDGGGWALAQKEAGDRSRSGAWALTDSPITDANPSGRYGPSWDAKVTYVHPIDMLEIPSPQLVFWHKYRFAAGDSGALEVRVAGNWVPVKTFMDVSGGWKAEIIPLDAYSRENQLQFRFRMRTDVRDNTLDDGWTIDDVVLGSGGRGNGRFDQVLSGQGTGEPAVDDAKITLFRRNADTGVWSQWAPAPGSPQVNPQQTDAMGRYGFYGLPVGEYRVTAESRKYGIRQTPIIPIWDGVFAREIPILAGEPIYLPSVRRGFQ